MKRSEIITETRYFLDEMNVNNSHWGDTRLVAWINEGIGDAVMRLPLSLIPKLAQTWTDSIVENKTEYDFTIERMRIDFVQAWGRDCKIYELDMWNALTDNLVIKPTEIYPAVMIWGNKIFLRPIPESSLNEGLKVFLAKPHNDLGTDDSVPELPQFAHRWLITYAAYKALLEDDDPRADVLKKEYDGKFIPYQPQV